MGQSYMRELPGGVHGRKGIRIVAEESIPQTAQDISGAVRKLHEAKAEALVHCGFGFGIVFVNPALEELGWDPPRYLGTAFQNAWINPIMWNAILGWTGIDQYDEGNPVGQEFLDRFEAALRAAAGVLRAGREPRPRHRAAPRLRRRPAAVTPGGEGGAGAGEDAPGRLGGARGPGCRSGSGPAGAGWAPATSSPAGSTPTARAAHLVDRFGRE